MSDKPENVPFFADLQGPGPFQLPLLTTVDDVLTFEKDRRIEIRLGTARDQEVRIQLTLEAASILQAMLTEAEKLRTSSTKRH